MNTNKNKDYFLGIDTSCYTTSCALVDASGELIAEERKLLEVKVGGRGLAQSEMVFQHTRALPTLLERLPQVPLAGIGVSAFPRREASSYMPAFLVGHGVARSIAHMLDCSLYEFSHQENHMLAALREMPSLAEQPFIGLHVSGGTTEILLCREDSSSKGLSVDCIGGSSDLNAGQFIDRIGVQLGYAFPAGPSLEKLAEQGESRNPIKISVHEGFLSFSGPASEAKRRIEKGTMEPADIAADVFQCIANGLQKLIEYHVQNIPEISQIVAVGGVMSNHFLRKALTHFADTRGKKIHFAAPKYSADNATGNAYGACRLHAKNIE